MLARKFAIAAAMSLTLTGYALAAPSPIQTVQTGASEVLELLRTQPPSLQRRDELQGISNRYIDFAEMSRRALGANWNRQSPEKQREFIHAFSQFLFNRYISQIEEYKNVQIDYKEQQVNGNSATVETVVHTSQGEEIPITYRLELQNGQWKAYDILADGVSLVNNYRSQFNSVLARNSMDDLLAKLRDRNQHQIQ